MPDGNIVLYCKGADAVILERVRAEDAASRRVVQEHVDVFAKEGLRTLAYAAVRLTQERYAAWEKVGAGVEARVGWRNAAPFAPHAERAGWSRGRDVCAAARQTFLEASVALENRQARMDDAAAAIEVDLELLGATAIEDRLQAGVPETIERLQQAGIHVWVLTGDKLETAVNVGYASALIRSTSTVLTLVPENGVDPVRSLASQLRAYVRPSAAAATATGRRKARDTGCSVSLSLSALPPVLSPVSRKRH